MRNVVIANSTQKSYHFTFIQRPPKSGEVLSNTIKEGAVEFASFLSMHGSVQFVRDLCDALVEMQEDWIVQEQDSDM